MTINSKPISILTIVLIWVTACCIGISLRLYPLLHFRSDQAQEQATMIVLNTTRKHITQSLIKSHPDWTPMQIEQAVQKQIQATLHQNRDKVRRTIDQVALKIDLSLPNHQNPYYLMEADSYYYLNLTENILDTGSISNQIRGSKYFNPLMLAPKGYWEPLNLHPYLGASIYKIIHAINPEVNLRQALSYTPIVLTMVIILVYILGLRFLQCPLSVIFISTVNFLCVPIFLRRSMFGWYKNDPTNILFLLLIPLIFFLGLHQRHHIRKAVILGIMTGVLLAVYACFWQGWVFLASLIFISALLIIPLELFWTRDITAVKNLGIFYGTLLITLLTAISLEFGYKDFFILFQEGWSALQDFISPHLAMWPDLYLAVSELLSPDLHQWFENLGGPIYIIVGILGVIWGLVRLFLKKPSPFWPQLIFIVLFWGIAAKMSFSAQRFFTLCLIPFALAFALGLKFIAEIIQKQVWPRLPLICQNSWLAPRALVAGLLFTTTFIPANIAYLKSPDLLNRIFNDTWNRALTQLKEISPADSIINSWWPPGHFIKAISHRRVTFDGATINKPQAYWLANVFLAQDENAAAGILRMLNVSGNDAVEYLTSQGISLSESINLLKRITSLDKDSARNFLNGRLQQRQIEELLALTHANPPPSYLLIYNEMAEGIIQFSFVGNWDFKKVEKINQNPQLLAQVPKRSSKDYMNFLWQISSGAPRISSALPSISHHGQIILFEQGVQVNTRNWTCRIDSPRFGHGVAASIFYTDESGQFIEKVMSNATLPYSLVVSKDSLGRYQCLLADSNLCRSLIIRLYYFQGKGLKIFEPVISEQDTTGRTKILVYKINWQNPKS